MSYIEGLRSQVRRLNEHGYPLKVLARYAGLSRDALERLVSDVKYLPQKRTIVCIERMLRICKLEDTV